MVEVPDEKTPGTLLGVFARYWVAGDVKTRLARRIGNVSAARLHRQFVETTLTRMAGIAREQWLVVTPPEAIGAVSRECGPAQGWRIKAQVEGDLGRRMQSFFLRALEVADRAVLIGSDSPDLPPEYIDEAVAELSRSAVVVGPAADGGYYLIGLAADLVQDGDSSILFDDMPWSSDDLLSTTLGRLAARQIDCHLLPPWSDVDDWSDLVQLHRRLCDDRDAADKALADLRTVVEQVISANRPEQDLHG